VGFWSFPCGARDGNLYFDLQVEGGFHVGEGAQKKKTQFFHGQEEEAPKLRSVTPLVVACGVFHFE